VVTALQDVREKLGGLREAIGPMAAGQIVARETLAGASQQLSAFGTSLAVFRDRVSPPKPGASATEWSG